MCAHPQDLCLYTKALDASTSSCIWSNISQPCYMHVAGHCEINLAHCPGPYARVVRGGALLCFCKYLGDFLANCISQCSRRCWMGHNWSWLVADISGTSVDLASLPCSDVDASDWACRSVIVCAHNMKLQHHNSTHVFIIACKMISLSLSLSLPRPPSIYMYMYIYIYIFVYMCVVLICND